VHTTIDTVLIKVYGIPCPYVTYSLKQCFRRVSLLNSTFRLHATLHNRS